MNEQFVTRIAKELAEIETAGLFKKERIITSEQGPEIVVNGKKCLIFALIITLVYLLTPL